MNTHTITFRKKNQKPVEAIGVSPRAYANILACAREAVSPCHHFSVYINYDYEQETPGDGLARIQLYAPGNKFANLDLSEFICFFTDATPHNLIKDHKKLSTCEAWLYRDERQDEEADKQKRFFRSCSFLKEDFYKVYRRAKKADATPYEKAKLFLKKVDSILRGSTLAPFLRPAQKAFTADNCTNGLNYAGACPVIDFVYFQMHVVPHVDHFFNLLISEK